MASKGKPGRHTGTKVTMCVCGRRVVGTPGARIKCPGCKKQLSIKATKSGEKRALMFLKPGKNGA